MSKWFNRAAAVAMLCASVQAGAVVVPNSTFDFGLAHIAVDEANTKTALFQFRNGVDKYYERDDGQNIFGDAFGLQFDLFEEDRGPDAYQLIFYLQTWGEMFPARDGVAYEGGVFGLGINDAVDLDGTYRLTGARISFGYSYTDSRLEADLLTESGIVTDAPWDGRFPGLPRGAIGLADLTGTDIIDLVLRLDVARMAPPPATGGSAVPEPSSWALMVLGFDAVGLATRRRRGLATA